MRSCANFSACKASASQAASAGVDIGLADAQVSWSASPDRIGGQVDERWSPRALHVGDDGADSRFDVGAARA